MTNGGLHKAHLRKRVKGRVTFSLCLGLSLVLVPATIKGAVAEPRHGLSSFGELKYRPDFKHFDYVHPEAPKGGEMRLWALDSFDSLNPFILRGVAPEGLAYNGIAAEGAFVFEGLLEPALDEPDSFYGLIAESVDLSPDRRQLTFTLRSNARFHDGTPIQASDVIATLAALIQHGHPRYRLLYQDVEGADAPFPRQVVFRLKPQAPRDLPLRLGVMPVLSAAALTRGDLSKAGLEPLLASGPYRIARLEAGRNITYERVRDYWGRDLPVNRGRHNFDRIRHDYYRDRDVALQAFFSGQYDFRMEPGPKNWATGYEGKRAVTRKLIQRETLSDHTPSGVQGFFLNTRREKLADRRVRLALAYAYDFEWSNKTLFYGLFKRMRSMFENSDMAARGVPSEAERALLEPFRKDLPAELFSEEFIPPRTDGSGEARENLRRAQQLLFQAGYEIRERKLVSRSSGEPLRIEFLLFEGVFQRVIAPYLQNLERLGIEASVRLVDNATFQNRMESFDFDIIIRRFVQPQIPGSEQRNFWGSVGADTAGSLNFSGIKSPAVDALIGHIEMASSYDQLVAATRALDRVLSWNWYVIPHFYSGNYRIAYWNKFGRPATMPRYGIGHRDTWWQEPAKVDMIKAGTAPPPLNPPRVTP